jgi:putative ABC transport system permease protein
MRAEDIASLAMQSLLRARLRSSMMLLAMGIGVAAVIVLTALGEGARRYVTSEFSSLGTDLIIVVPGRTETGGVSPALMSGNTPRDLTLQDLQAVLRLPEVRGATPIVVGQGTVSSGSRERDLMVLGTTASWFAVRQWTVAQGEALPAGDAERTGSVVVIGRKVASDLFPGESALGRWLRIGDRRFRVVGILATQGRSIGFDAQDAVMVPVASALAMFDKTSLYRILVQARSRELVPRTRAAVIEAIRARHQGEEDVTVITQDAVLKTFDNIFGRLSLALAGIAAVSLVVAGVLVMNVMLVSVSQRTAEVGLLKALGAQRRHIAALFLAEAALLALAGGFAGVVVGLLAAWALTQAFPLEAVAPGWAIAAGLVTAMASGLVFGILPARRAARLDPVLALAGRI